MAGTQITSLICNNFGGIRRKQSSFSDEQITCSDCQNVELFFTGQNSGVGIRTASGNSSIHNFSNENIIGMFKSNQGGEDVVFIHTEDTQHGYLYKCNLIAGEYEKIDGVSLTVTGKSCGVDFESGQDDYFIFSNGVDIVFLYTDNNSVNPTVTIAGSTRTQIIDGEPTSVSHVKLFNEYTQSNVSGLGLIVYDNRLWLFNNRYLYYSRKGFCYDFNTETDNITDFTGAGCIEFSKPITAISNYLSALAVFHKDSSCLVTNNSLTGFEIEDESPGGCANYNSLIFHGTDLYFYDNTKRGVFAFSQVVNGDKTLTNNIAEDIQEELLLIQDADTFKIRTISIVTEDRNEVWFILPISDRNNRTVILIYDYIRSEWVKRVSNVINCALVFMSDLYSGGKKLYKEYQGKTFDGEYVDSFYKCSILNCGTDNTLKVTKFPPRLTVDTSYVCDFWVEYIRNYDYSRSAKRRNIKNKTAGGILFYDCDMFYDNGHIYSINANAITKLPSTTFKALEINFKTETNSQGFCIKNIEFSKLKIKQV